MTQPHVGVLLGGLSAEREVSIATGEAVCEALRSRGHRVTPIDVDAHLDRALAEAAIDVAFIALHGTYGEDGCVQGMLELLGIPYTGAGVLASALAMDKLKSKELFRLYNVPTPPYYGVDAADATDLGALVRAHGSFGFPVFVKPRSNGSSVGAGRADDVEQLAVRVQDALRFDRSALVERFVDGREIAVGLLDGKALGAIEIEPTGRFYDYHSKYTRGGSVYHLPARLSPTRYQGVLNLAERAVRCVGALPLTPMDKVDRETDSVIGDERINDPLMQDSPFTFGEIPKVNRTIVPSRVDPSREDSVLVRMVDREKPGDRAAIRRANRMQQATASVNRIDSVRRWWLAHEVLEHRLLVV